MHQMFGCKAPKTHHVHSPAVERQLQRAATDREIVRVVRDWWDSPTAYDSDLIKRVSTLLTKEGEGIRRKTEAMERLAMPTPRKRPGATLTVERGDGTEETTKYGGDR